MYSAQPGFCFVMLRTLPRYFFLTKCRSIRITRSISIFSKSFTGQHENNKKMDDEEKRKLVNVDKEKYKLIYSFPFIRIMVGYANSKNTFLFSSLLVIFPSLVYVDAPPYLFIVASTLVIKNYLLMMTVGKCSVGLIGAMYVNKEGSTNEVVISTLDINLKRVNMIHDPKDISYYGFSNRFLEVLRIGSILVDKSNISYKLSILKSRIHDKPAIEKILGNI